MCDRGRNAAHAQPKEERSIQMSQKKIEEQQRKILFAHFKAGTLERKMDTAYRGEETADTAETTESAKPVRYDYEFDFKYLLGNYYKAYQGDDYYNDMKDGCAEINELEGKTEHDPILLWYIYKKIIESEENKEKKKFYDALRKYAKLTGCLGNFVLVPKGFNAYRGLASAIKDYWDLSLHELRYDRSGQGWLDQVDMPFNKYINLFFLWDYVSGKKNEGYRVRPLFKSHEAILMREKMVLPRKAEPSNEDGEGASDDFSEFTKNANRCILRRGAFMSTMLRISAKYSDSYDKIVEYLATDASLGSMEDVIEQLKALSLDEEAKGFLSKLSEELKI